MTRYILPLLLVASIAQAEEQSNVYYDNIVVVLDGSGSMAERMSGTANEKMQVARDALKTVLRNIGDNTQIGIIAFGNVNHEWVYPLALKNVNQINAAIDSINADGGTPLGEYMKKGADALLQQRAKQRGYGSYRLLVVTDGEATDQSKVDEYVPDIKSRGIFLDVIGVDMKKDHGLSKVANSYRKGNNPNELQSALQEVFAEVSASDQANLDADFELIEPIQNDLAMVIVKSFGNSGNQPIGEKPPPVPVKVVNPDGSISYVMPEQSIADTKKIWAISGGVIAIVLGLLGVMLRARRNAW